MERLESLWKCVNVFRALRERMGAFGRLGRLGSMVWYGMYVSKHKHKEKLGTFGSVLESLEAFGKRLDAFQAFWDRMGAFGRLSRLVSIITYVWYVCVYHNNKKQ